jgi:hypothetical protein
MDFASSDTRANMWLRQLDHKEAGIFIEHRVNPWPRRRAT